MYFHIFFLLLKVQNYHGLFGWSFGLASLPCSSVPMRCLGKILSQFRSEKMETDLSTLLPEYAWIQVAFLTCLLVLPLHFHIADDRAESFSEEDLCDLSGQG